MGLIFEPSYDQESYLATVVMEKMDEELENK